MTLIQIRRDNLFHKEPAAYVRTEMSKQKEVRDSVTQKVFAFEPFVACDESEGQVWIAKEDLVSQLPTAHDLSVYVFYSKPVTEQEMIAFKAA